MNLSLNNKLRSTDYTANEIKKTAAELAGLDSADAPGLADKHIKAVK